MNKSVNSFGEFNVVTCVRFINPETLRVQNFARNDKEHAELAALKQQHFLYQRKTCTLSVSTDPFMVTQITTLNCRTCYTFEIHSSFVGRQLKPHQLYYLSIYARMTISDLKVQGL